MKLPEVNTPLGIIALFVALIELFLSYPVTQLQGTERLILVIFMTAFPFFVASAFFFILWYRPIHLYRPQEVTPGLENRYQADVIELARLKAEPELQVRREKMAKYIKEVLQPGERDSLANSLNLPTGDTALRELLTAIAKVESTKAFDVIAQKIKILFGRDF